MPATSCTMRAVASAARSVTLNTSCPTPAWRSYSDVSRSRARSTYWPRPSLSWLRRQRWLIQQTSSGLWLENLTPSQVPGQWQPVWSERVQRGLQFATEEMGKRVYATVRDRIGGDVQLRAVTFVAPPSDPTLWRPMDG